MLLVPEAVAALQDSALGPLWYSLILAVSVPCCMPSPPFEIIGGYIFSPAVAAASSIVGKTCGACFAFLASRIVAKHGWRRLGGALASRDWLARLGLQQELKQRPLQTLCIIRASPLPSFVKSYVLGLSDVSLSKFALACVIINTPYSIAWAFAGSSATSLQDASTPEAARGVAMRVFVCLAVFLGMSVAARRAQALMHQRSVEPGERGD